MNTHIIKPELSVEKLNYHSVVELIIDKLNINSKDNCIIDCTLDRKWSKSQVLNSSLNFAYYLINDCKLTKGEVVCFVANNSDIHAIGIIGVLMAGGVYSSLSRVSTELEINPNFDKIQPSVVVCVEENYETIHKLCQSLTFIKKVLLIDQADKIALKLCDPTVEDTIKIQRKDNISLPVTIGLDDIATFVMSSGSTGQPKAIIKTNRNHLATVEGLQHRELSEYKPTDIMLANGFVHISGQRGLFSAINGGAQIAIARVDSDVDQVFKTIHKYQITTVFLIPTQINYLIKTYPKFDSNYLKCLKDVVTGGAPISPFAFNFIQDNYGFEKFRCCYGMSETGWSVQVSNSESQTLFNCMTIGKVCPNTVIKIIDDLGYSLPANEHGQLCIGGDQVTPGYLNNDEETTGSFTSDGFIKSGDIGYYDENYYFFIVGRIKEIINVETDTGIGRITPAELENILIAHPEVVNAAVIGIKDKVMGQLPMAFVTVIMGSTVSAQELTDYVNSRVNYYKQLRGGLRIIDTFPLTPLNKINKMQLKLMAEN